MGLKEFITTKELENEEPIAVLRQMIKELDRVAYGVGDSLLIAKQYPKDFKENLAYRRKILLEASKNVEYRLKVKELFHKDILFAFNTFFYTKDVRKRPSQDQPFCTYAFQDIALLIFEYCIENKLDIPIEKSRDMGLSWLLVLTYQWFWLKPKGGADFLVGSRIEDYVDKKGDMRTLIQKARYNLYKLPKWLRPVGFAQNKHDHFMRLLNPETGNSITGESNNPNYSTGGRYASVLYDEFGKWESTDVSAWTAGGDATPCRIPNSTPNGAAGQFYDLVNAGRPVATVHWTLHPEKAHKAYCFFPKELDIMKEGEGKVRSPWYDKECIRRRPEEIAQELDIDYIGAGRLVFDGKAALRLRHLLKLERVPIAYYSIDFGQMKLVREVSTPRTTENYFVIYENPSKDTCYSMGVDVAEGIELGDFAVAKIMNRLTGDCAASYAGTVDEILLSRVVELASKFFSMEITNKKQKQELISPWIGIETNGPGLATFDLCALADVPNLFMMPKYDSVKGVFSVSKGWKTTSVSRNVLITSVRSWLSDEVAFVDIRCAKELSTFVRNKVGKGEAKAGAHDDEVIAWGIAIQVNEQVPLEEFAKPKVFKKNTLVPDSVEREYNEIPEPSIVDYCLQTIAMQKAEYLEREHGF